MTIESQISDAYRSMATQARYRPAAPSDGWGNITVPEEALDIYKECASYVQQWMAEEDEHSFQVGCPSFEGRPALIFVVEAARAINGVNYELARDLLRMAVAELENLGNGALS